MARLIGERGWRLVYGGGRAGLMGAVASGALEAGGEVIGEPMAIPGVGEYVVFRDTETAGSATLRFLRVLVTRAP